MLTQIWGLLVQRWDFFQGLLVEHVEICLVTIIIAIVFGGIAGILISEYQKAAKPTLGAINFLYTIPSISMLGFLIPFSGIGDATAIIALTIYALLPMVRSAYTGMTNVDPAIMEAAKGMGGTRMQTLVRIQLPLALPVIMSGIRNMVTMTIALGGIASYIGAGGLGVAIYRGITTNNTAMTIVGSLLIAVLALAVDAILGFVEKRMQMHGQKAKRTNRRLAVGTVAVCAAAALGATVPGMLAGPSDTINVATKPMTEQYIMGEALKMLIEHNTSLEVNLTEGVAGGTSSLEAGMESGQFDLTAASVAIEQMLELRGVEKVDLVGNSLGGMVALRVAAENPSVVRRLVLISTPVIPSKSALRMQRAVLALRPANRFTEVPKATVLEALDALARSEISTDLSRVKVPTLAIVPAADQPLLAAAEVLRQQLGATVETVDGEGDLVRDHGDRIASLIDDFTRGE